MRGMGGTRCGRRVRIRLWAAADMRCMPSLASNTRWGLRQREFDFRWYGLNTPFISQAWRKMITAALIVRALGASCRNAVRNLR
jgi:hypothetical protein